MKNFIKIVTLFLVYLVCFSELTAQTSSFTVINPQQWSSTVGEALVSKSELVIEVLGAMAKVDITMEIELEDQSKFLNGDQFEIVQLFSLPKGAFIFDAYLWMEDIPVKAKLYKREVAKDIYESLVKRKVDPLIIYKNVNKYELRIFPLLKGEPRKIKISIMVPISGVGNNYELANLTNLYFPWIKEGQKHSVTITEDPAMGSFIEMNDFGAQTRTGNQVKILLTKEEYEKGYNNFSFSSMNNMGELTRVIKYPKDSNSGYFQMFYNKDIDSSEGQKILYIIDVNSYTSGLNFSEVVKLIKQRNLFNGSTKDSFNVVFGIEKLAKYAFKEWQANTKESWAVVDSVTKDASSSLETNSIYLLDQVFNNEFKEKANEGNVLIISSNPFTFLDEGYINKIIDTIPNSCIVSVLNTYKYISTWDNRISQLEKIASRKNGSFLSLSVPGAIGVTVNLKPQNVYDEIMQDFYTNNSNVDLSFYSDAFLYDVSKIENSYFGGSNSCFLIHGQYYGKLDSVVTQWVMRSDSSIATQKGTLLVHTTNDSSLITSWAGTYYNSLISSANVAVDQRFIIEKSKQYNVLTDYTAFLALEPELVANWFSPTFSVPEIEKLEDTKTTLYPNPFEEKLTVSLGSRLISDASDVEIQIRDITGRIIGVKKVSKEDLMFLKEIEIGSLMENNSSKLILVSVSSKHGVETFKILRK